MLVELEQGYGAPLLTEAQLSIIATHAISPVELRDDESNGVKGKRLGWSEKLIVSADMIGAFPGWSIVRTIDNGSTRSLTTFGQRNTTVVNERCHVAVAGLGLLTIDEVEVEGDCCTDHLNKRLSEGWRIVAVCVQPDQRRPDYVLGRTVGSAKP